MANTGNTPGGGTGDAKKQEPTPDQYEATSVTTTDVDTDNGDGTTPTDGNEALGNEFVDLIDGQVQTAGQPGNGDAPDNIVSVDVAQAPENAEGVAVRAADATTPTDIKSYDERFDVLLAQLDKTIEERAKDTSYRKESLSQTQIESLNLLGLIGRGNARGGLGQQDLEALESNFVGLEQNARRQYEMMPTQERDIKATKGMFLISSGLDRHIQSGEKLLAELVRDNPSLSTDSGFRELLLSAYVEMTARRNARGLGEWKSSLTVDQILPAVSADGIDVNTTTGELMKKASAGFFADGIEKSLPLFERAQRHADYELNGAERERLDLFLKGLGQDAGIARASFTGQNSSALIEERAQLQVQEEAAYKKTRQAEIGSSSTDINTAFAKIASGDPRRFEEGKAELAAVLKQYPDIAFRDDFKQTSRNAFKAYFANSALPQTQRTEVAQENSRTDAGITDGARPATAGDTAPGATPERAGEGGAQVGFGPSLESPVQYKQLQFNGEFGSVDDDPEIEPYAVDTATTIGLTLFGLGMGAAAYIRSRNALRSAREVRAQAEAAHELKPVSRANEPLFKLNEDMHEVKGRTADGRVVMVKTESAEGAPSAESTAIPMKERAVPKGFDPLKGKFADLTPIAVDGNKYYVDGNNLAYEYKRGKLQETENSRKIRVVMSEVYGQQTVGAAIDATAPTEWNRILESRSPGNATGAHWERISDLSFGNQRLLNNVLRMSDWTPYNPVDAGGEPLVKPPQRAFRTEIPGGRLDSVGLDTLPADTKYSLVDREGNGNWSLVADKPGLRGDKADFATMVVGPELDGKGQPTGREVVQEVFVGDPVKPTEINDTKLLEQQRALREQGKGISTLSGDLPRAEGAERRIDGITLEQARALGYGSATVEKPGFANLPPADQVGSIRELAEQIDQARKVEISPRRPSPGREADMAQLLRDTARAIEEYRPGSANTQSLSDMSYQLERASQYLFENERFDDSVSMREIRDRVRLMERDAYVEQYQGKPQQALLRSITDREILSEKFARTYEAEGGGETRSRQYAEQYRARQAASHEVAELMQQRISQGLLQHTPESYDQLAKDIDALAIDRESNRALKIELQHLAQHVRDFANNREVSIRGLDLKFHQTGAIDLVERAGESYKPGRLKLDRGMLESYGDIKGWLERDPARVFEVAKLLSSGQVREFDLSLGAAVSGVAENMRSLSPQQFHDELRQVLEMEKESVRAGKPAQGLRFLYAAGITSAEPGSESGARHGTAPGADQSTARGVREHRPSYYSTQDAPTEIDRSWKGLETGSSQGQAEADLNFLAKATGRWHDGVVVSNGAVVSVGDLNSWLREKPTRVFDILKLVSDGNTKIGMEQFEAIEAVRGELKNVDRTQLFDGLTACLEGKSARAALNALEITKVLPEVFPGGDFSTPEKALQWLATQRVQEALAATPEGYMQKLLETRTPGGRAGSYWETIGGQMATPQALSEVLKTAQVTPYNPLDANGRPIIKPPARGFQAEIPGGRMGLVNVSSLPPDTKLSLIDPKGTGFWSLSVNDAGVSGEPTNKVTFIVGPDVDASGRPTGKELMWTLHPGDPVSPSPVNDAALATATERLAAQGQGLVAVGSVQDIPKAVAGQARRIDNITVEQARALGFDLAKLENPRLAQVDRYGQANILEQHAQRLAPQAQEPATGGRGASATAGDAGTADATASATASGDIASDSRVAELYRDAATALREFQPNGTTGDALTRIQTDMKAAADVLIAQGRYSDAISLNEAREAILPLAARSEANQLIKDLRARAEEFPSPEHSKARSYSEAASYIERTLNMGGFPENNWGYDTLRRIFDAEGQDARNLDMPADGADMASAKLRRIAEGLPAATTTRTDAGAAATLSQELTQANQVKGVEGISQAELAAEHRRGNELALEMVAAAERNPQCPRNRAAYSMLSRLLVVDALGRHAAAESADDRQRTLEKRRAAGVTEVYDSVKTLSSQMHDANMQAVGDIFTAAEEAGRGPVDNARIREVVSKIPQLREMSPDFIFGAMNRILLSENPSRSIEFLKQTGVLKEILPEVTALDGLAQDVRSHPENNTWEHIKMAVENASKVANQPGSTLTHTQRRALMWATLLHDIGMPATQQVAAVEGEPPKITYPKHDQVGADMTDRVLDRFHVPEGERELVRDLVREHMNMHLGLRDQRIKELMLKHGDNFALFVELQKADALGRAVHTREQYERLKLKEAGMPSPVDGEGRPVSASEYWKDSVNTDKIQAQETKIRQQMLRESINTEFRTLLKERYGVEAGKRLGDIMKASARTIEGFQSPEEARTWLENEANRESIGIKYLKADSIVDGGNVRDFIKAQPNRLFDLAVQVSAAEYSGYDYGTFDGASEARGAIRTMSPQEVAAGLQKVLACPDPRMGLSLLKDAQVLRHTPPTEGFPSEQAKQEWIDQTSREIVTRLRADRGGLSLARSMKVGQYRDLGTDYATERERVMSLLERADREMVENPESRVTSADREAFTQLREAYGRGEPWAISIVQDGLSPRLGSKPQGGVPDVPASVVPPAPDAYLKEFPERYRQAVYDAYVERSHETMKTVSRSVVVGLKYLDQHPNLKPRWDEVARPMNEDARAVERAIDAAESGHSGASFADAIKKIQAVQADGFEAFARVVEEKGPIRAPGTTPGADTAAGSTSGTAAGTDTAIGAEATTSKSYAERYRQAVYDAYVERSHESMKNVSRSVVVGLKYLDANPNLRPQWDEVARPINEDARAVERVIDAADSGHSGVSFADTIKKIQAVQADGFEAFARVVEEKGPIQVPGAQPTAGFSAELKPGADALAKLKADHVDLADRVDRLMEQLRSLERAQATTERIKWSMSPEGGAFLNSAEGLERLEKLVSAALPAAPASVTPQTGSATTGGATPEAQPANAQREVVTQSQVLDSERRPTDPTVPQEVNADLRKVRLPGGLEIFVDAKMEKTVGKYVEKYNQDANFRELMANRLKRQQDKIDKAGEAEKAELVQQKQALEAEIARYEAMPAHEKAAYREVVLGEAMSRYSARMAGRARIAKALGTAGTAILVGMVVEHAMDLIPDQAPADEGSVTPTVKSS